MRLFLRSTMFTASTFVVALVAVMAFAHNVFAYTAFAQPAAPTGTPEEIATRRMDHLKKALKLTDEQVGKIKPTIVANVQEMQKAREEKKGDRKAIIELARTNMEKTDASIRAVLTPEQQTTFDKMTAKMKDRAEDRMEKRKAAKEEKK